VSRAWASSRRDCRKITGWLIRTSSTSLAVSRRPLDGGRALGEAICRTATRFSARAATDAPADLSLQSVAMMDGVGSSSVGSSATPDKRAETASGRGIGVALKLIRSVLHVGIGYCGKLTVAGSRSKSFKNAMNNWNKQIAIYAGLSVFWCALFTAREHSCALFRRRPDVLDSPARIASASAVCPDRRSFPGCGKTTSAGFRTSWRRLRTGHERRSVRATELPRDRSQPQYIEPPESSARGIRKRP